MKAIIELQKLAMDSSTDIVELVRHAYAIAYKLELQDFVDWCNAELKGYDYYLKVPLPDYRLIHGNIMLSCSDGNIIPMNITNIQRAEPLKRKCIGVAVHILASLLYKKDDFIPIELSPKLEQSIKDYYDKIFNNLANNIISHLYVENDPIMQTMLQNRKITIKPYLSVHNSEIVNILESIRNRIIGWALECEKQGILGEGLEFTQKEKEMAQNITYHIGSVQNMANHNTDTTINQTSQNMSVIKGDFQSLSTFLSDKGINHHDIQELQTIIESDPIPDGINDSKIQGWVGKVATKMANGTITVATGVTVEVIVKALEQFF